MSRNEIARSLSHVLRLWVPLATATAAALAACGGGSTTTTPPPAATTMSASGAITGFGSVIVDGREFADASSTITDDDGHDLAEADLRLGMQADVDGTDDHGNFSAGAIVVHSALVGAVEAVDTAAGTITVLEQTVQVDAGTAIDEAIVGGLAGLTVGQVIEVHAQFDAAAQTWHATRVGLDADASEFKIRGMVTALDTTAKTLQVGATHVDYSGVAEVPRDLAVGGLVIARLQTTAVAGVWQATRLDDGARRQGDHDEAHVHGIVSAFTSATSFSVDGTPVDASNASFPDGQAAVVLGASVEVEGRIAAGVLVATSVSVDGEHEGQGQGVELHGTISSLDTTSQTFVVRATTVSYAGSVAFRDLTAATLANGLAVEVKGSLSSDGTIVDATEIDRQN